MSEAVYGGKCTACGAVSYPRHLVCPKCRGEAFQPAEIAGEGLVLTYTDVYALAIDYDVRYLRLAIVELDGGLRVTGQLLDEEPKLGKRVRTTVGVVRETAGKAIYGLQFVPA
jgi:uncharacterized OB-fold protein